MSKGKISVGYKCRECGYKGNQRAVEGRCPACDSYNIRKLGGDEKKPTSKWASRLRIMYLLFFVCVVIAKVTFDLHF